MPKRQRLTHQQAIDRLKSLAKVWPSDLMLFSFSGSLGVLQIDDYKEQEPNLRDKVLAWIPITSDGGDPD